MANQHQGSLAKTCQDKFQQPLEIVLNNFYQRGLNLQEVVKRFGARVESVNRWAKKYNLNFSRASVEDRLKQVFYFNPAQVFLCCTWVQVDKSKVAK